MPAEPKKRLDVIGFVWEPYTAMWEEGFAALEKFKQREGHCQVPTGHMEDAFNLGNWVSTQRKARKTMATERRKRLDTIGFVWDMSEVVWEEGFTALEEFKQREGHCRVPGKHVEGAFNLGNWVNKQRRARKTMSAERKKRLDVIGFVWSIR